MVTLIFQNFHRNTFDQWPIMEHMGPWDHGVLNRASRKLWHYIGPCQTVQVNTEPMGSNKYKRDMLSWCNKFGLPNHTRPCRAKMDQTKSYKAKQGYQRSYGNAWDHMEPYGTIRDHKGPYRTICDCIGPNRTIRTKWDHTGPYWTIQGHTRPYEQYGQNQIKLDQMGP